MMMFYLIGKGKAVKDAMAENNLTGDYYRRIAAARKPVFSIGTFAMVATMIAAILGASVDTGVMPPIVHGMIAYGAIACNLAAAKIEIDALAASSRIVDEVNAGHRSARLVNPVLELVRRFQRTTRAFGRSASRSSQSAPGEQVAILGLDQHAAEVFVNLITGATLPDQGGVTLFGRSTESISDSAEWLALVDRFGILSERAVLLEALSVVQNIAVPFTLEIEPPPDDVRHRAEALSGRSGARGKRVVEDNRGAERHGAGSRAPRACTGPRACSAHRRARDGEYSKR